MLIPLDVISGDIGQLQKNIFGGFVTGSHRQFNIDPHHILSLPGGQFDSDVPSQGLQGEKADHHDEHDDDSGEHFVIDNPGQNVSVPRIQGPQSPSHAPVRRGEKTGSDGPLGSGEDFEIPAGEHRNQGNRHHQ